ncbi:hypothetical protein V5799_009162 [Amblyomma americanum]|uniref:Serine protease inhibitor n=1 Tax=Amblyomma americanum TaxID=6943 RepID=A0AAQ4FCC1_AMBAM
MTAMSLHIALEAVGALPSLSSTGPAAADWYERKTAWSLFRMSNAEFFYLRYAYFMCNVEEAVGKKVNAALKLSPGFAAAFGCGGHPGYTSSLDCANVTELSTVA